MDDMIKLASLTFTGATVLVGIELFLLSSTWRNYKEVSSKWPRNKRGIPKAYLLNLLHASCWLLGISLAFNVASLIGVMGTMLGLHLGPLQAENLNDSRYGLFLGGFFFIWGIFWIGWVRFEEALYWWRDKANPLVFESNDVQKESAMDDAEVSARCRECDAELKLKRSVTTCPNCGSAMIVKHKEVGGTLDFKGSLSAIHEFRWSGTAWTILGIFLTLWATIFFGLCFLNNLSLWANLLISLGIMSLLFLVIWLGRNQINNLLNWVERRFTGRKTYHSD